jgi:hypothetical protein
MSTALRIRAAVTALAVAASIGLAAPACASYGPRYGYGNPGRSADGRAYTIGYREGRSEGERDARRGRRFDYSRHDEFRDSDRGYRGRGPRRAYQEVFREGFVAGYRDGYGRNSRRRAVERRDGRDRVDGRDRFASPARQNGFRDGYAQGRDDARDRDPFDPVRSSRYRSADRDYDSRYGSRENYRREYRVGFEQGYERGYRENRRR